MLSYRQGCFAFGFLLGSFCVLLYTTYDNFANPFCSSSRYLTTFQFKNYDFVAQLGDKTAHGKRSLPLEGNERQTHSNNSSNSGKPRLSSSVTPTPSTAGNECKPVQHILFLKTHKTGSSTITNILNRYGDTRELNMALPQSKSLYTFVWPTRFRISYTANLYGVKPNILCNHARYNKRAMHWLFPKDRSVYITILREPLWQYESVFNFMHLAYSLGYHNERDPLATFLKFPLSGHDIRALMKKTLALHLIRNPMLFDLGLDFRYYQNYTAVQNYFDFIDREYDLVMIMEYFDESLVLLKRILCWDYEDILYFKLNERPDKQKRSNLTEDVKRDIKSWNQADAMLYERFNRTLWEKIEKIGPEFYKELKIFRNKNRELQEACLEKGNYLEEAYSGVYVKGYRIKKKILPTLKRLCQKMMRNEISYVKYFRSKSNRKLRTIEEPEEYLDDPKNDWDQGSDFQHDPDMSRYTNSQFSEQDDEHAGLLG